MHINRSARVIGISNLLSSLALLGNHYNKKVDEQALFLSQDVRVCFHRTPLLKDTVLTSNLWQLATDYYIKNGVSMKLEKYVRTDDDFIDHVASQVRMDNLVPVILMSDEANCHTELFHKNDKQCLLLMGAGHGAFTTLGNHAPLFCEGYYEGNISYDDFFSLWDSAGRLYFGVDFEAMKKLDFNNCLDEDVIRDHSFGFFDVSRMAEFVLNIPYYYTEYEIKMYLKDICHKIESSCIVPARSLLLRSLDRIERDSNRFIFEEDKYTLAESIFLWKVVSRDMLDFSLMPKTGCFRKSANTICNISGLENELRGSIHEKVCSLFDN